MRLLLLQFWAILQRVGCGFSHPSPTNPFTESRTQTMAATFGVTTKSRATSAGEENQDVDWESEALQQQ